MVVTEVELANADGNVDKVSLLGTEGDEMTLSTKALEKRWSNLLLAVDETNFTGFLTSPYFEQEGYKADVFDQARKKLELESKSWGPEDFGTGEILKFVTAATDVKVLEGTRSQANNLVDWRQKSSFVEETVPSADLEKIFFELYKDAVHDDKLNFEGLWLQGLGYRLIAYLFFIKDKDKYAPISQQVFDIAFQLLGVDFKTSGKGSWENYHQYCDYLKQVRDFLKTKDPKATLLDAHSFLFVLGYRAQMEMDGPYQPEAVVAKKVKPPASQEEWPAGNRSFLPRAQAPNDMVTVLKAGGESGSITLTRAHFGVKGLQFTLHTEDMISGEHGEHGLSSSQLPPVDTWNKALALLDRFDWTGLDPLAVHEDLRVQVWTAVKQRIACPDGDDHSGRSEWHRLCFPSG